MRQAAAFSNAVLQPRLPACVVLRAVLETPIDMVLQVRPASCSRGVPPRAHGAASEWQNLCVHRCLLPGLHSGKPPIGRRAQAHRHLPCLGLGPARSCCAAWRRRSTR